jgi:pimeloyl-ACP methyl ester carboxylesterase
VVAGLDDHASDIAALHDHLMFDPVVLIGLSIGGRNAMMFTAIHPGKVEKLVLVDIGPDINPIGSEQVRRIKVPTLIMRGSESDIFTVETVQCTHDLIPGSQFVEIQDAGHSIPTDAPDAFEKAVRGFLAP